MLELFIGGCEGVIRSLVFHCLVIGDAERQFSYTEVRKENRKERNVISLQISHNFKRFRSKFRFLHCNNPPLQPPATSSGKNLNITFGNSLKIDATRSDRK